MPGKEPLRDYHRKRRFDRTAEPEGGGARQGRGAHAEPAFVVQIHDASTMHFDFRLEVDGVLRSWAVPKGPSSDPQEKRLALPTEDHPLEYADFEGVIAPGEYGGGTVIIWDEGTFRNLTEDRHGGEVPMAEALERGHASFALHGRKLHGGYALTRTGPDAGRERWLLVKKSGSNAAAHHAPQPHRARSARTGRTLKRVAEDAAGGN
ncbi:DNA polymerase ligase N-terminal domain-containing protein [Streptomyces sp. NPDC087659]|uniref:DNA polymerase ligase N-terminal domain-containing protein n=1 Tax=unclassified Streptomyces TaxID=2593676 RepID=UPI0036EAF4BF